MKKFFILLTAVLCICALGCGKEENASVFLNKIEEISFHAGAETELELDVGECESGHIKVTGNDDFTLDDIVFVSTDSAVASFEYDRTVLTNYVYYTITARSAGETVIYVRTADGLIKSGEIKITVADKKADSEEYGMSGSDETGVYIINTSSKKYHKESCASSKKIKESNRAVFSGTAGELASMGYEPCKMCN